MNEYNSLEKIFTQINYLKKNIELIYWDLLTIKKNIYKSAIDQIVSIKTIIYEIMTNEFTKSLIQNVDTNKLNEDQKINFNLMKNFCDNAAKIPLDLIILLCRQSITCSFYSKKALESQDFGILKPHFTEVVNTIRKIAQIEGKKDSKYDSFLQINKSEISSSQINDLILSVSQFLKNKVDELIEVDKSSSNDKDAAKFDEKNILEHLILPNENVIIDYNRDDIIFGDRNLIRIISNEKTKCKLSQLLHAIGKGLYLRNLPYNKWDNQPICSPCSLSMYNAQGFLFSHFFLEDIDFAKKLKVKHEKNLDPTILGSNKFAALMHLMIKFSLERSLINGELEVEDLPSAWQEDVSYYFHAKDEKCIGLLNSNEWFHGRFGYYPCYLKGMMIAAQIFYIIKSDSELWRGEKLSLKKVVNLLITNIYNVGARYSADELLKKITGETLDCRFYKKF